MSASYDSYNATTAVLGGKDSLKDLVAAIIDIDDYPDVDFSFLMKKEITPYDIKELSPQDAVKVLAALELGKRVFKRANSILED